MTVEVDDSDRRPPLSRKRRCDVTGRSVRAGRNCMRKSRGEWFEQRRWASAIDRSRVQLSVCDGRSWLRKSWRGDLVDLAAATGGRHRSMVQRRWTEVRGATIDVRGWQERAAGREIVEKRPRHRYHPGRFDREARRKMSGGYARAAWQTLPWASDSAAATVTRFVGVAPASKKTCESIPDKASRKAAETERTPSVRLETRTVKGALARAIDGWSIEARNGQLKWSSKHVEVGRRLQAGRAEGDSAESSKLKLEGIDRNAGSNATKVQERSRRSIDPCRPFACDRSAALKGAALKAPAESYQCGAWQSKSRTNERTRWARQRKTRKGSKHTSVRVRPDLSWARQAKEIVKRKITRRPIDLGRHWRMAGRSALRGQRRKLNELQVTSISAFLVGPGTGVRKRLESSWSPAASSDDKSQASVASLRWAGGVRRRGEHEKGPRGRYLVDPARSICSSQKTKPCKCKYESRTSTRRHCERLIIKGSSKLVKSRDVTGKYLSFTLSIFFSESSAWENKFMVSKTFLGNTSFYLLIIFATATPKWEQNFSKIIFSFLGVVKYRNCLDASSLLPFGWNLPSKSWLCAYWWQCIRKLFNSCKTNCISSCNSCLAVCAANNFCNTKFVIAIGAKGKWLQGSNLRQGWARS